MPLKLGEGAEKIALIVSWYPVLPEDASQVPSTQRQLSASGLQLRGCNDLSWMPWRHALTCAYVCIQTYIYI